jgi:very-short-patch-repair endonuclease
MRTLATAVNRLHPPSGGSKARNEPSGRGSATRQPSTVVFLPSPQSEGFRSRERAVTEDPSKSDVTARSRALRKSQTTSEGLLWSVLRASQLCGLKFRRQHPIEPWFVDFACPRKMLVVEIDGGYHDHVVDDDLKRQKHLEALGWKVIRFTDKEVQEDSEAVARAIARELNLPYEFKRRSATGSGMKNLNAPNERRT